MRRRLLALLLLLPGVVWLLGTRGAAWADGWEEARALAGDRLVLALVHDPARTGAVRCVEELRRTLGGRPEPGGDVVLAVLETAEVPAPWELGGAGFAVVACGTGGDPLAVRYGLPTPEEFLGFAREVLRLREALESARQRCADPSAGATAWQELAGLLLAVGDQDGTRRALDAMRQDPACTEAQGSWAAAHLAAWYAERGQAGRARQYLDESAVHALDPALAPTLLWARALIAHVQRDRAELAQHLEALIQAHPRTVEASRARQLRAELEDRPSH